MTTEKPHTSELFSAFDNVANEVLAIISSANEQDVNTVPFEGSWTAAQVAEHIRKAVNSTTKGLEKEAQTTDRNPAERANELKTIFLNYETKFKSPEFILPGDGPFERQQLIADLRQSFEKIQAVRSQVNPSELIAHPAFGEITKLELLHFILYHTQRHMDQMKRVMNAVNGVVA